MFRVPWPCPILSIEDLAIPAVSSLIFFLSYTSQYLFWYLEPGPLTKTEAIWFNVFVLCIWYCYDRACTVNPGRKGWVERANKNIADSEDEESEVLKLEKGMRWCKKCEAIKPPRAHHCRKCGRCIPKMDHHCPWTTNCVSHTTFPHFIRFVFYAVLSMSILAYHLFIRASEIFSNRNLPAYLGPPTWTMAHLLVLILVNSVTLFALSILLVRELYSLAINTTMIESWEIERHEALVQRARKTGGWVYASGGQRVHIQKQEYPYDIGIWANLVQAMGTSNVIAWFLPFGGGPGIESAINYEVNGFEDEDKVWPPSDPDKMPRVQRTVDEEVDIKHIGEVESFRKRQQEDQERWRTQGDVGSDDDGYEYESEIEEGIDGEEGWTNAEGDRLRDYGVDEDAEVVADDEIPLGELLRRRKASAFE